MGLAEAVLDDFSTRIDRLTLIPSMGGVFEVTINGSLIYSKKQTGQFPTIEEIKAAVRKRLLA